jgi:hypothetical protein
MPYAAMRLGALGIEIDKNAKGHPEKDGLLY